MKKQILKIVLVFTIATILIFSLKYILSKYYVLDTVSIFFGIITCLIVDVSSNLCKKYIN